MGFWDRIKKKINKWLEDMAAENKKSFGAGTPDCCKLNRDNKIKK